MLAQTHEMGAPSLRDQTPYAALHAIHDASSPHIHLPRGRIHTSSYCNRLLLTLFTSSQCFFYPHLLSNSGTQHTGPEVHAFRSLNDLLVYRVCGVIHEDCAFLVVELAVHSCVADEVYYPLLAFVLV